MSRQTANSLDELVSAIQLIDLDDVKKKILVYRFTSLLREYRGRSTRYSISFHVLRITITVGSLIVPALLSVQGSMTTIVYWCVWVLSLCVTISNGIMTLFKVDKKYYVLNTTYHHIISEGWQYIALTGRYDGNKTPGFPVTHDTQFKIFCRSLEKTRMKQVEDEYFRVPELKDGATPIGPTQLSPDMYSNPPLLLNGTPSVRRAAATAPATAEPTTERREDEAQSPFTKEVTLKGGTDDAV
jgi:hypothetical protein